MGSIYKNKISTYLLIFILCIGIINMSPDLSYGKDVLSKYYNIDPDIKAVTVSVARLRETPGTDKPIVMNLKEGKEILILGYKKLGDEKWYRVKYINHKGYVRADLLKKNKRPEKPNNDTDKNKKKNKEESYRNQDENMHPSFEEQMKGFPRTYRVHLRKLHKRHPKWIFKAENTGINWEDVLAKESGYNPSKPGNSPRYGGNLVERYAPAAWKEFNSKTYNFKKNSYKAFDGKWHQATGEVIAYYLDPRNFLDEEGIFQFMNHKYLDNTSSNQSIQLGTRNSFLDNSYYQSKLINAGKKSGVNTNVLISMIKIEQGHKGKSPLISGKVNGYEKLYNFFNIGAFHGNGMTAVERGLWWAGGEGRGDNSYGRPWNTPIKAIIGGAKYYSERYLNKGQYNFYSKKFNVFNGLKNVASHEYSTYVAGAYVEGKLMSKSYLGIKDLPLVFEIPVYKNMPASNIPVPNKKGNNDNYLKGIVVVKGRPAHKFEYENTKYEIFADRNVDFVKINLIPHSKYSKVQGDAFVSLTTTKKSKRVTYTVTSSSGKRRTYEFIVYKRY